MIKKVLVCILAFFLVFPAFGMAADSPQTQKDMEQLRQFFQAEREELARLQRQFAEEEAKHQAYRQKLEQAMAAQRQRMEAMRSRMGLAGQEEKEVPAESARVADAQSGQTPEQPVGRPPEKKPAEQTYKEIDAIFERQGVLTPRGKFVLEPSLQYSYLTSTRVVLAGYTILPTLTIGTIDVRKVSRNSFVGALATRYGLTNRLEAEVKVPYVYRDDSTTTRSINAGDVDDDVFNADGDDIGDVEFGFRYQFNIPQGDGPIFIGGVRVKSDTGTDPFEVDTDPATGLATELPTGSGFWGVQPSITAIVPSDPAVFFGSLSYMYYFDRDISGVGEVDPGDIIGFNLGVGYGINEKASFSLGYEHSVILKTEIDGDDAEGAITTHVGSLLVGASYRLNNRTSLNFSLSGGLTEDAPDVQLTLRMPITF